jgi:DNA-binding NarL/FixJ family response regulator
MRLVEASGDAFIGVLICDDNDSVRGMLRAVIERRPSQRCVGEATDGNEAVVEAARLQPDVIFLDLAMPNRTGLDYLPELRQVAPEAGIIIFSGFSTGVVAEELLGLGADLYLTKGASADAINDAIEEAVAVKAAGSASGG